MQLSKQPTIDLDGLITLPEAAKLIDLREPYVRRLVQCGRIAGRKFGRNYLVSKESAVAYQKKPGAGRPRIKTPQTRPNS